MYLEDTTIAPSGSWRATKIETNLIHDIAEAISGRRVGHCDSGLDYTADAERWLRMFIAKAGRYPVNSCEVEERFPGCFEPLRIVT
jgi:hypothetical protein